MEAIKEVCIFNFHFVLSPTFFLFLFITQSIVSITGHQTSEEDTPLSAKVTGELFFFTIDIP